MSFEVIVSNLDILQRFQGMNENIELNMARAINKAAAAGRKRAEDLIREQIAFPSGYLAPGQGRLTVALKAKRDNLEARIRARGRPTSLARFVTGSTTGSLRARVNPGRSITLKRAFLINLRAGGGTETRSNKGLAVRLKPGDSIRNKYKSVQMKNGLYLLYGPSVDQAFVNAKGEGVAADIAKEISEDVNAEFIRLMDLNLR